MTQGIRRLADMNKPSDMTNSGSSEFDRKAILPNQTTRRTFLQAAGLGAAALAAHGVARAVDDVVDKDGKPIQGFEKTKKASAETSRGWKPVSERKIRVGLVGYGFCRFGAAFGFQDHPNVDVVAV